MTKRDCDVLAGEGLGRLPGACGNEIEPTKTKEQRPETRSKFINRWGVVLAGETVSASSRLPNSSAAMSDQSSFALCWATIIAAGAAASGAKHLARSDSLSLVQDHKAYYTRDLSGRVAQQIVQPDNRSTAPAILSALLRIAEMDPDALCSRLRSIWTRPCPANPQCKYLDMGCRKSGSPAWTSRSKYPKARMIFESGSERSGYVMCRRAAKLLSAPIES
jgi:hypothetical protein